jgi:hypothetical protein
MIGIGTSISKGQVINDPSSISDLVLWYDFTNISSLRKNRDGTSAVTANNDIVHWAQNLASGDANGIMGSFMRSAATGASYGGTFKIPPSGQSYIQFDSDGTEQTRGFRSGFISADATDDGGVAADKFSDVSLDTDNMTVIQVFKHDDAAIEADDHSLFIHGYPASGSTTDNFNITIFKEEGDEKLYYNYIAAVGGVTFENTVSNDALDTNVHLMVQRSASGTNNMTMEIDGVQQADTDTAADLTLKLDKSTGYATASAGAASVSIGGEISDNTTSLKSFHGAIYETLIYNRALDLVELASLEVYFAGKYGITIS